jgi:hypothetical protein
MAAIGPSIRIQVVLFQQGLADVWRLWKALGATMSHARSAAVAHSFQVVIGDCSPAPVLQEADVAALEAAIAEPGVVRLRYTFFHENIGSAGGSNRLAMGAEEDFILVLNPDTYPAPIMLSRLLSAFADPLVGAADARQIPLEHPKDYDIVSGDTSWVSGSCLLVRTNAFHAVGGFDTDHFFLYCDDVDFSWRIRLHGNRVVHVPDAVVFHDKRIRLTGTVRPTPLEGFYGVLGRLMLARRYDRPDILEQTLESVDAQGTSEQRAAVDEWRRRLEEGTVPIPIAEASRVAEFTNGEYARHRF